MADEQEPTESQGRHRRDSCTARPGMWGEQPSAPAVRAADVFRSAGARDVPELVGGHGRDAHFGAGTDHGNSDSIHEHGGFAVHFADRALADADAVAEGWPPNEVHAFEEGDLPRRPSLVTQDLPR
ncbi:hypothetical protein [Streptomyces sp. NPDC056061]|uniref:hypothetical protein n=1 Tax=Streptomyces sp. NPDC056061 TaxID=3345700 RepID=UPI0035DF2DD4